MGAEMTWMLALGLTLIFVGIFLAIVALIPPAYKDGEAP